MYRVHRIPLVLFCSLISESGKLRVLGSLIGIPFVVGVISAHYDLKISVEFLTLIVTALTLFVGFSMTSVIMLLRYADSSGANPDLVDDTRNISTYLISLGIIFIFGCIFGIATIQNGIQVFPQNFESFLVFGSLTHYLMVVLLFPARIFSIVENTGGEPTNTPSSNGDRRHQNPERETKKVSPGD